VSHYFESPPDGPDDPRLITLQVQGRSLELRTGVGVFSRERIDHGTTVLLQTVPAPPTEGNFLDLGCGYGPIALTMASLSPNATVWAVDVNDRARELSEGNAAKAGLTNVHFNSPEEVPPDIRFSVIWSNPPIRIGKAALRNLLRQWLSRLEPAGEAFLVVQRHLGSDSLQHWLTEQGWPTSRLRSRQGFRVLQCQARTSR
jgi:16S rRNA (guanine1207-N2)-methyltransferase